MYYLYNTPPMREMQRLRRQMSRLFFDGVPDTTEREMSYPATNIWANEEKVILTAELPGFAPEDIEISVAGDALTLTGSRAEEKLPEGGYYHREECVCGKFARTVRLPFEVNPDKVEAVFEKGVLRINMERAEQNKPRKINVKQG